METKRRLKKIGGSAALFVPPEMLEELGLEPGSEVEVVRRREHPRPEG
ncbi:MAG: AbrB/MazE/SpoVT family DNA-binding domain-containing protein [Actinomycetota bacterium]|nr:AbrB/MazE/SpoVT family DNA-binding domain-containing protein [Actinomycetota bacterium]